MSTIMLSPIPSRSFVVASGNVYQADQYGIIPAVLSSADVTSLKNAGCYQLNPPPTDLLGYLIGANFNSTADQLISLSNSIRYRIRRIVILNASITLTTAAGGFYSKAGKASDSTHPVIVANTQTYNSVNLAAGNALEATLNTPAYVLAAAVPLYLSLTTPQGAAATADVYVYGDTYPSP